ncbi:hypothetical protein PIB30_084069 [Stylosanthes scabra]|uniref:Uncharacterized protein n=1 Tax=Stylosanthes scabra TaxID=79078 RepID=A0ABU6QSH9_9FABA|nr:hypothetical protein [Stylosanthes scabra]
MHDTTFLMEHDLLIYVLMTEGVVNLPRIMRDVMLKFPTENSRHLLPYPIFILKLTAQYQKGVQHKVHRGRLIPPAAQAEQHPPSLQAQPSIAPICQYREFTRAFIDGCYEIPAWAGSPLLQTGPPAEKHADYDPTGILGHDIHRFSAGFFCRGWQ